MTADAKNVVITGSTRGIGKGMAREFLNRGHNVVISGRTQDSVDAALADLKDAAEAKGARLAGVPCDVSDINQVQSLWDKAVEHLGSVDIWINNAGRTNSSNKIATLPAGEFSGVVGTNLLGTMYGCQVALRGMQAQGHGALYTFEGFGSNGMQAPGNHVYGTTKYAITYFTKALINETKGGPVLVGYMSPGMVTTDLLLKGKDKMPPQVWEQRKKVFNILADHVETVTPFLVEGVLANTEHGARIAWLTRKKSMWRFFKSRFSKRDLFAELDAKAAQA